MGKRVLVFILLAVVVVAGVAVGATLLFQDGYKNLEALQAQEAARAELGLDEELPEPINTFVNTDQSEEEPAERVEAPVITTEAGEDVNLMKAQQTVANMTLEEKICQMMFVTQESLTGYTKVTQSGSATQVSFNKYPVGGVIYFAQNLVTMDQTKTMISNLQNYARERSGFGLFIGVDEEGGSVARLADNLGTTEFEDMAVYGATGDTQQAYDIGYTISEDMRSLGFNVDFAPVADVLTNRENTVVADRSFGSDPKMVAAMVKQEVRGFVDGGVLCAPKHFPGHGSTGEDTHDGFASPARTTEELQSCDLVPFQEAITAGAPMIMVGHMTMTEIDKDNPASLSSAIVNGMLRAQMGYEGIIITDALNMEAITDLYTSGEAAVKAVQAGCDMLLCVNNLSGAVEALTEAVENGEISEARIDESVVRILTAKYRYGIAS